MRRRGGGVILMIASIWGRESGGRMTYNAVKAAEISLAKSMAQQLARDNIRVNSVAPGSFLSPRGARGLRSRAAPEGGGISSTGRAALRVWGPPREAGGVAGVAAPPAAR